MIEKKISTEFGNYVARFNHGYEVHNYHYCIDSYVHPEDIDRWGSCPCCGLKPKIWEFDNGRSTACGCGNDDYDHFSIVAESIMSVSVRCGGSLKDYDRDELRKNWNDYCSTMIATVLHQDLRDAGKW